MSCNCHEMNRRELFEYINQISFAVDDVKLFLVETSTFQKGDFYVIKTNGIFQSWDEVYAHTTTVTENIKRNVWKHSKNMQRYMDL